jgi:hypothetical protein
MRLKITKAVKSCIKYIPSATISTLSLLSITSALVVSQITSLLSANGQSTTQKLYQLHNDGWIYKYVGSPGWLRLDNNPKTKDIVSSCDFAR